MEPMKFSDNWPNTQQDNPYWHLNRRRVLLEHLFDIRSFLRLKEDLQFLFYEERQCRFPNDHTFFFAPNLSSTPLFCHAALAVFKKLYDGKNTIMPAGTTPTKFNNICPISAIYQTVLTS